MDYLIEAGTLKLDHTSSLHLELPETRTFSLADPTMRSSAGDLHAVENAHDAAASTFLTEA